MAALAAATESEIRKEVAEYIEMVSKSDEPKEAKLGFLEVLFRYLNAVSPDIDEDFLEMTLEKTNYKESLMSLFAEKFRKEGRHEEKYATMLRLHTLNRPLENIALAVNLSETSVKTILKRWIQGHGTNVP